MIIDYKNKSFEEKLKLSNILVDKVCNHFKQNGFMVKNYEDKEFYENGTINKFRGCDVFCAKNGSSFFVECKDHPRMNKYNATGIPIYVYKRYLWVQDITGLPVLMIFCDNEKLQQSSFHNLFITNGEHVPYGGFISNLKPFFKQNILSKQGYNQKSSQIIWDCNYMDSITNIIAALR